MSPGPKGAARTTKGPRRGWDRQVAMNHSPGPRPRADGNLGGDPTPAPTRKPVLSMALMAVFLVGGSAGILASWPAGPGNLDWGVWTVLYGGYAYVIAAAVLHARTGR